MATFIERVTLEEAVRMSKCINNISFRWLVCQNILDADSPNHQNCTFADTEVFWRYTHDKYRISANFQYKNSPATCSKAYHFTSLESLCKAYPELFSIKGRFKVIN